MEIMERAFIEDKTFDKVNFATSNISASEYEHCTFTNCNFQQADLSGISFIDCDFVNCDLSLATLKRTTLINIKFNDCKMLGLHFERCNDFGLSFQAENCILNHSSFFQRKLKKTILEKYTIARSRLYRSRS